MSRADQIVPFTNQYAGKIHYDSSSGDNDHDGIPNRADLSTGGNDCSGWVWNVDRHCYAPAPPPISLTSSAGMALVAKARGWINVHRPGVPVGGVGARKGGLFWGDGVRPGDTLLRDKYGDVYNSGGPRGHCGKFVAKLPNGTWRTSESASSRGVNFYERDPGFWNMAVTLPGMSDQTGARPLTAPELERFIAILKEMEMTSEQDARLERIEAMLANLAKPGALQTINARLELVEKALFNPGATGHTILQDIQSAVLKP